MDKKKAIIKFTIFSAVIALVLIFSFISFPIAGAQDYVGFANAIEKNAEFDSGIYVNYQTVRADGISDEDYQTAFDGTFERIENIVETKGLTTAKVYKVSNTGFRIETTEDADTETILGWIGAGELKIRTSSSSTADVVLEASDVSSAFATQLQVSSSNYQWGTWVQFTEEGKEKLATATANATSSSNVTLYFYRGDATSPFFSLPTSSQITYGYMFISDNTGGMTQADCVDLAIQISCGCFETTVETVGSIGEITAHDANYGLIGLSIAIGVTLLAMFVLLIVMYREFGLMGCMSILFFAGFALFFMQAVPGIELNIASIGAVLLGCVMIFICNILIFENIKNEYSLGKKLNIATKTGFKKSIGIVADICGGVAIISLAIYLLCSGTLKSLGLALLMYSILVAISTLALTGQLVKSYVAFNKDNGKRVNFTREENSDEIA